MFPHSESTKHRPACQQLWLFTQYTPDGEFRRGCVIFFFLSADEVVCADEERDLLARREAFQLNIHGDAALVAGKEHRDIARTGKVREQLILHGAVVTEDGIPAEAPVLRKHRAAAADRHAVGNDVRIICASR